MYIIYIYTIIYTHAYGWMDGWMVGWMDGTKAIRQLGNWVMQDLCVTCLIDHHPI